MLVTSLYCLDTGGGEMTRLAGFAVAFLMAVGSAQAETLTPEQMAEAVRGALIDVTNEAKLTLCFDQARLMIFGAYQNEKERPIELFVESGALPVDSSEYKFVAEGYRMQGVMDDASKDYFLSCVKSAISSIN